MANVKTLKVGLRVRIFSPAGKDHGESQFHNKTGTLAYRSDIKHRWFVHLDGDEEGWDVEFWPGEIKLIHGPLKGDPRNKCMECAKVVSFKWVYCPWCGSHLTKRAADASRACANFQKARDGKCYNCGFDEESHR